MMRQNVVLLKKQWKMQRGSNVMTQREAKQIVSVVEQSSWEEILQKCDNLFERNGENGSFCLQSKFHRAKECLEKISRLKDLCTAG